MNQLHHGSKWIFRIDGIVLFAIGGFFLGLWLVIPQLLKVAGNSEEVLLRLLIFTIIGYIIFVGIATEIYAHLSYNNWFYEFTNDGLKLERGIIWKAYSNVPYERIQNVDIQRGLFARIFGFSSVSIQTAGYGGRSSAEGFIPAVEVNQAEEIRDFLMKKLKQDRRNQGI